MKKYYFISVIFSILVILASKIFVHESVNNDHLNYENIRKYIKQMVFVNDLRSRNLKWEALPIPIYFSLHSSDIRSEIEKTMRTIENNLGVPIFLETSDYKHAKIFLVTSLVGQERLSDFLVTFIQELLGPAKLELLRNKFPTMFDPAAYPKAPPHPCFTKEFFSDASTQHHGGNRIPTQMLVFIGNVSEIESGILSECLVEELLHAAFFLRDAELASGAHSIFNQFSHENRARVPTPFDLCLLSELLTSSIEATDIDEITTSIYQKITNGDCPYWQE